MITDISMGGSGPSDVHPAPTFCSYHSPWGVIASGAGWVFVGYMVPGGEPEITNCLGSYGELGSGEKKFQYYKLLGK